MRALATLEDKHMRVTAEPFAVGRVSFRRPREIDRPRPSVRASFCSSHNAALFPVYTLQFTHIAEKERDRRRRAVSSTAHCLVRMVARTVARSGSVFSACSKANRRHYTTGRKMMTES